MRNVIVSFIYALIVCMPTFSYSFYNAVDVQGDGSIGESAYSSFQSNDSNVVAEDSCTEFDIGELEELKRNGEWRSAAERAEENYQGYKSIGSIQCAFIHFEFARNSYHTIEAVEESRNLEEDAILFFFNNDAQKEKFRAQVFLAQSLSYLGEEAQSHDVASTALGEYLSIWPHASIEPDVYFNLNVILAESFLAERNYEEALKILTPLMEHPAYKSAGLDARTNVPFWLARVHRNYGLTFDDEKREQNLRTAIGYAQRAVDEYAAGYDQWKNDPVKVSDYAVTLETLSSIEWRLELGDRARQHLREAIALQEQAGATHGPNYIYMLAKLSAYLLPIDDIENALIYGKKAVDLAKNHLLESLHSETGLTPRVRQTLSYASVMYLWALERKTEADGLSQDDYESISKVMQSLSISPMAEALKVTGSRASKSRERLHGLIKENQKLRSELSNLSDQIALLVSTKGYNTDLYETLLKRKREIVSEVQSLRTNIEEIDPNYFSVWLPQGVSIARIQNALREDEAYFHLTSLYSDVNVLAITKDKVDWHIADFESHETCRIAVSLRNSLSKHSKLKCARGTMPFDDEDADHVEFNPDQAYELFHRLFDPLDEQVVSKSNWLLTVSGPLSVLPFSVLLTEEAEMERPFTREQAPKMSWLGRKKALTMTPSADSFVMLRNSYDGEHNASDKDERRLIVAGAPCVGEYFGSECDAKMEAGKRVTAQFNYADVDSLFRSAEGDQADTTLTDKIPSLPGAYRELTAIEEEFEGYVESLIGSNFTEREFRKLSFKDSDNSAEKVMVLATHVFAAGELGLDEPAFVTSPPLGRRSNTKDDGIITTSEIAQMSLALDWIVLSGCNTAGPDGRPRNELFSGLALGFLSAGARALLLTHYETRDDFSAYFTPQILNAYSHAPEEGKAHALRRSIDELLSDESSAVFWHPSHWGALTLYGAEF